MEMIRKNKSLATQLREMKVGQTITISARSGVPFNTLKNTAGRLRKEGYDYKLSTEGLPKGACTITRVEPRAQIERPSLRRSDRTDHDIVVLKALPGNQVLSQAKVATTFEVDYTQAGEPRHISLPVIYDRYEYWSKRMREAGETAANNYIAKLIEDTLQ